MRTKTLSANVVLSLVCVALAVSMALTEAAADRFYKRAQSRNPKDPSCQWGDLYAVVAADLRDPSVGENMKPNIQAIGDLLKSIEKYAPLHLTRYDCFYGTLRTDTVRQVIRDLPVTEDDTVLFYYSGHGSGGATPWPKMSFEDGLLELDEVIDALQAKKPRLLIVISDCCNWVYRPEGTRESARFVPSVQHRPESYRKLFYEQRGFIYATSSRRGEYSFCHREGSMFTIDFLSRLDAQLCSEDPDWTRVWADEINVNSPLQSVQHPYWVVSSPAGNAGPAAMKKSPAP